MGSIVLETRRLSYRYPCGVQALDCVDMAFLRGARNVVLGTNGAGKSTLFMLLNGVLRPAGGEVLLEGEPLDYRGKGLKRIRTKVGILFQDPDAQLISASIREDVSFGPMNLGLDLATVKRRVDEALSATHLESLADRPVHALSYGQKRRAGIAGLLAMHPEVLILDEPTAGLDPQSRQEFFALLDGLRAEGLTIVLSTHDIDLAYGWADAAFVLHAGRLRSVCEARDFPRVFPSFRELGLGLPQVIQVQQALQNLGIRFAAPARDFSILCERLMQMCPPEGQGPSSAPRVREACPG